MIIITKSSKYTDDTVVVVRRVRCMFSTDSERTNKIPFTSCVLTPRVGDGHGDGPLPSHLRISLTGARWVCRWQLNSRFSPHHFRICACVYVVLGQQIRFDEIRAPVNNSYQCTIILFGSISIPSPRETVNATTISILGPLWSSPPTAASTSFHTSTS